MGVLLTDVVVVFGRNKSDNFTRRVDNKIVVRTGRGPTHSVFQSSTEKGWISDFRFQITY